MGSKVLLAIVIVISAVFFGVAGKAAEKGGLVFYLPFDEGSGGKVEDLSGNGNHGVVNDCEWVQGKFGSALEFKGTATSFVEVPDCNTLSSWQALTVSVWVMLESYNQTWGRVVDKDGDPPAGVGYWMATRDGGAVSAGFWNQPQNSVMIQFTDTKIK